MNIDHIEAFIYAVHLNSIHKAADALFLSQPTVTARIKTLERELGQALFKRSGRGIKLTEKGREFFSYAEQIVQTYEKAKKQLSKEHIQKEVVIGANPISSQYFIPHILPLWKEALPDVHFTFITATNEILVDQLIRKEIHIAFLKEMSRDAIYQSPVLDNSVRLVCHPNHPLANKTNINVDDLSEDPLVFFECGAFDWNRIHKMFEAANVSPRIEFRIGHLEVAKSLIQQNKGIGFLPSLCIKEELKKGTLVTIETDHILNIKQQVYGTYYGSNPPYLWDHLWNVIESFEEKSKQAEAI
jgi:DNA-binding transcriptional LysR family regulator